MYRHWENLIRPVCDLVQPKVFVEVGSRGGLNTKYILEYCKEVGAHAHVIDPAPIGNEDEIAGLLAEVGTYHQDVSLNALQGLAGDVVLLDGDHNWFTVLHELKLIEETARAAERWPVCLFHDVSWPYGRRDLYYAPERIPAEHRQPYARQGLVPGRSALIPGAGYNLKHDNATTEGGPKNGVLTGIEDFAAGSEEPWELHVIPVFHGLGVLIPTERLAAPVVAGLRELLRLSEPMRRQLEAVELARMSITIELLELYRRMGGRPGPRAVKAVRMLRRLGGG